MVICASPTRSIFRGGIFRQRLNTIEFITIASTGNAVKFGEFNCK
jgi:hypothetical protein